MKQCVACLLLLLFFIAQALAAEPTQGTGPWNVERILDSPTPFRVDAESGNLRSIHYPSEPCRGKETEVFAYFAVPQGQGPFPAMLLVHGGGGTAFEEWARLWADRGYVALAMDLAGCGPDGQRLPKGGPPQDDESKFGVTDTSPLEDAWTYQAVAAVLRGHALLSQQPQVDPSRIGITGISWGGYLTCIVAGIDHRLAVAVPVYGCGFLADNSYWQEAGRFENLSPVARQRWLQNFDPSHYLAGVQCPTLFVNGTNDFAYPLDSYQKTYSRVTAPRTLCVTVNMPHGHQAGWAPAEIGAFVDSVLLKGKPLATLADLEINGEQVSTAFQAPQPLAKSELHFTTDTGRWQDRNWTTVPAEIDTSTNTIQAMLPTARPLVCFLTAHDDRGLVVSTAHREIPQH